MMKPYANRSDIEVVVEHDEAAAHAPPEPGWTDAMKAMYDAHELVWALSYAQVWVHIPTPTGGEVSQRITSSIASSIPLYDRHPDEFIHIPAAIELTPDDAEHLAEVAAEQTEELLWILDRLGVELRGDL
jgi:hypothetical protein